MKPEELIGLSIPAAFFLFWGSEWLINRMGHGRSFPKVRGWTWVGVAFFLVFMAVNVSLPVWLPPEWIARSRLMNLTGLGLWGALPAYLAVSLVAYGFHRAEHRFDVMWRAFHQLHHAVERVDMPGFPVGHPLETVVFTAVLTLTSTFVLGVDPVAAALVGAVGGVINMFQHWNVPTPRWLGYLIVRPEQHCLHHERGIHARNYSGDLVLWDMLFGSYANPPRFEGEVGYGISSVRHLPLMLAFADVGERSAAQ